MRSSRRQFLAQTAGVSGILGYRLLASSGTGTRQSAGRKPNFIVILCDDLGYGDIGCFGSKKHRTPNIDRMAVEGARLTSFYVSSGVCTPSRASLLTGCYPRRVNMHVSDRNEWVLFPVAAKGLNPNEMTIAEVLKQADYKSACIGKWHLGDQPEFLPTRQGFDYYYGLPYSNDMGSEQRTTNPPLPLMRGEEVIEAPANQATLTRRYTEEALNFITENKDRPFFLYLPHTMPHNPIHPGEAFRGKSANGAYGDAVEEIDWSTGRILTRLEELGIDDRTLVILLSDNGAEPRWGGSNAPLSGWKTSTMEGAMRVPCLMRWPGKIGAGIVSGEILATLDILPTLAHLAGVEVPPDRLIDGHDIWAVISGQPGARSPHEAFYYYFMGELQAVRSGKWKYHLARRDRKTGEPIGPKLFDLETDVAETTDRAADHPDTVKRLQNLAERARLDLGDGSQEGKNQRPAGTPSGGAVPLTRGAKPE